MRASSESPSLSAYLLLTVLLPSLIDANAPQGPQYLTLSLLFAAIDGPVMLGYAAVGDIGRRRTTGAVLRCVDRLSAGALLAITTGLAIWRRPGSGIGDLLSAGRSRIPS